MRDVIDGNWINARLTGRRGEKAELAAAMGITFPKLSRILNGERQVQPEELPRLLAYFKEETRIQAPLGLAESIRPFTAPKADIGAINRLLRHPARHPVTYILRQPSPALDLAAGDVVIVDIGSPPKPGDLVIATEQTGDTQETFIARWAEPWLVRGDGDNALRRIDDNQRTAILGPVAGMLRSAKA